MDTVCSYDDAPSENSSIGCLDLHSLVYVLHLENTAGGIDL